jgi:hypothetical protein
MQKILIGAVKYFAFCVPVLVGASVSWWEPSVGASSVGASSVGASFQWVLSSVGASHLQWSESSVGASFQWSVGVSFEF